jgi:ribose transport system permease protein
MVRRRPNAAAEQFPGRLRINHVRESFAAFKASRYFGISVLVAMTLFFWAFFRLVSPTNFGSSRQIIDYLQTSIQYAVGGCGLYFIVVM